MHRSENGSYKIVNNYSLFPTISSRRGKLAWIWNKGTTGFLGTNSSNVFLSKLPYILLCLSLNDNISIDKVGQDFCEPISLKIIGKTLASKTFPPFTIIFGYWQAIYGLIGREFE